MIILQKSRLYTVKGDVLVGVEIYPNGIILQTDIQIKPDGTGIEISLHEVMCKFGIYAGVAYKFPRPIVEVKPEPNVEITVEVVNEPVDVVKKPVRGRPRK